MINIIEILNFTNCPNSNIIKEEKNLIYFL